VAEFFGWVLAIVFVLGALDLIEFTIKISAPRANVAAHPSATRKETDMDNQHRKINGYRELTAEEIDLMNRIKAKGTELLQLQAELAGRLSTDHEMKCYAAKQSKVAPEDEASDECVELRRFERAEPHRWAAIGKTDIQTGIMALVRAVAQPDGV